MRAPGTSLIRRWKYTENESKLARRIRGMQARHGRIPRWISGDVRRVGKSVGCGEKRGGRQGWLAGVACSTRAARKKGLMQRSRIITHMAGNAYFTLIKSVFFFARLSNLLPSQSHTSLSLCSLAPDNSPFRCLPSFYPYISKPWWVGNQLLSFPTFPRDVLIILNSDS